MARQRARRRSATTSTAVWLLEDGPEQFARLAEGPPLLPEFKVFLAGAGRES